MNPKPKIIALDLDGTMLTYEKKITPRTYAALEKAAAQGHYVVPATGRALHALLDSVLRGGTENEKNALCAAALRLQKNGVDNSAE